MKLLVRIMLVLALICTASSSDAQTGTISIGKPKGPITTSDTVTAGQYICLDSTVTSFVVDMNINGQLVTRHHQGCCFQLRSGLRPGTKIYLSEIISEPQKGTRVKLPARQFYVR